jgi:hypothetical protein
VLARPQGQEADRLVTRIAPGVVSLLAELRGHERQAAEELGQWKTHHEERTVTDAPPAAIKPAARVGEPAQVFPANAAAPEGRPRLDGVMGWRLNAVVCTRLRGAEEALRRSRGG